MADLNVMSEEYLTRKIFGSTCFSRYKLTFSLEFGQKLMAKADPPPDWDKMWRMHGIRLKEMGFGLSEEGYIYHVKNLADKVVVEIDDIKLKYDEKLLPFQINHTKQIIRSLKTFNAAFDGSETGTGKTYVACVAAKELDLTLFVVCPKTVISAWWRVIDYVGVKAASVTNYELLKSGKYLQRPFQLPGRPAPEIGQKYQRLKAPFLRVNETKRAVEKFEWRLKPTVLVVFDEVQRCKNRDTLNHRLLVGAKHSDMNILMLSATLASNAEQLSGSAYALGLYPQFKDFRKWLDFHEEQAVSCYAFDPVLEMMKGIHDEIFPLHGARMRIDELGDLFPKYQIVIEPLDMGEDAVKIQEIYTDLQDEIERLKKEQKQSLHIWNYISKARQEVELCKIPTMVELAQDIVEADNSCVIFVNFNNTMDRLLKEFKTKCCIRGGQSQEERDGHVRDFCTNNEPIIVANLNAGGVGVSLHDPVTKRPRVSLINPSFNAMDLKQAIGRVRRAKGGHSVNRVLVCADTIEESIYRNIRKKIKAIDTLNDRDFTDWMKL